MQRREFSSQCQGQANEELQLFLFLGQILLTFSGTVQVPMSSAQILISKSAVYAQAFWTAGKISIELSNLYS